MRAIVVLAFVLSPVAALAQEEVLARAQEAYGKGRYEEARDLALQGRAGNAHRAWRLYGAASCFLKDRAGTLEALAHLPAKDDVEFLRFACGKNDIEFVEDDIFVYKSAARAEVEKAQKAYEERKYGEAKKQALAATAKDPGLAKGWRLLGASACWLRDKGLAQQATGHLQPIDQDFVRGICARTIGGRPGDLRRRR